MLRKILPLTALLAAVMIALWGCSDDCVECPKESPILHLNKHEVSLGTSGTSSTVAVTNKGGETMSWSVSISPSTAAAKPGSEEAGGWLSVTPLTGSGDGTITCTANRSKLSKLGISRAMLIINAPDADNTTRDSVEVTIVKASDWLISDDDGFDSCATITAEDYYWVKEFHLPTGVDGVIVDSISFHFCAGNEEIRLLAYDWTVMDDDPNREKFPGQSISVSAPPDLVTATGWINYPVNWYITADTFYIGYFQLGLNSPAISIDTSPGSEDSTGCWTARDINPAQDTIELNWFREGVSKTFAIRVHVTPAFQYLSKPQVQCTPDELMNALESGYRQRGIRPARVGMLPRH